MQEDLLKNAIAFSEKIVELALPIRMGICSILTEEKVSIFNNQILKVLEDIAVTYYFRKAQFN